MVEEMYQQEHKEAECAGAEEERDRNQSSNNSSNISGHHIAQTPTTPAAAAAATTSTAPPPPTITTTTTTTGKRSDIINNAAHESDPSLVAINRSQGFSENQAKQSTTVIATNAAINATASEVAPPVSQCFDVSMATDDTCRYVTAEYETASASAHDHIGSTLIRFGTTAGDVSLTLGLRHAGNMPEKTSFSVRDFGGI